MIHRTWQQDQLCQVDMAPPNAMSSGSEMKPCHIYSYYLSNPIHCTKSVTRASGRTGRAAGPAKGAQGWRGGRQLAVLHGEALHGSQSLMQLAHERRQKRAASRLRDQRLLCKRLQPLQQPLLVCWSRQILACARYE